MRTLHTILFTLLLLLTLSACKNQQVEAMLDQAESIMQERPVEALSVLRTIDATRLHARSQEARYAMLYTQAQYKNYIDTRNDSLIRIAYDYYVTDLQGTDHDRMLSALMLGHIQKYRGQLNEAMFTFQRALAFGNNTDDYFMIGQVYANLAYLCSQVFDADQLKYSRLAYDSYMMAGAQDYLPDALCQQALAHYRLNNLEQSKVLMDSAIVLATVQKDTAELIHALRRVIDINIQLGLMEEADQMANQLKQLGAKNEFGQMAALNAELGHLDSARYYLELAKPQTQSAVDWINYHNYASWILGRCGDYKPAYRHLSKMQLLKDSLMNVRFASSVNIMQRDFLEKELEVEQISRSRQTIIWVGILIILVMLFLFIYLQMQKKAQIHRMEMENTMSLVDEIRRTLQSKQGDIDNLSSQLAGMKKDTTEANKLISSLLSQNVETLNGLFVSYFNGQNPMFEKNQIYKEVQRIVKSFSADANTFAEIEKLVDQENKNILQQIRQEFPQIKEVDYKFLCYSLAGFSSRAISLLLNESVDNIYQKRSRWKAKLESNPKLYPQTASFFEK